MLNNIAGLLGVGTPVSTNSYESIQTVTVGSGGQTAIDFTSIPNTYKHLQIRAISRDNRASTANSVLIRMNSDTGANYAYHSLNADGTSVTATGLASQSETYGYVDTCANTTGGMMASAVIDILDYADTNKKKVIRTLGGNDQQTAGFIRLASGLWNSTSAITAIRLYPDNSASFVQYSQFALYGIKG